MQAASAVTWAEVWCGKICSSWISDAPAATLCNLWRWHSGILLSKRLEQASQKTKLLRHNITFFLEVFGNIHYLSKSLFRSLYMLKYIHIVFSMISFLLAFFFNTEHYWNASLCFHWDIQSEFYCSVVKEEQTLLDSVTRNTNH